MWGWEPQQRSHGSRCHWSARNLLLRSGPCKLCCLVVSCVWTLIALWWLGHYVVSNQAPGIVVLVGLYLRFCCQPPMFCLPGIHAVFECSRKINLLRRGAMIKESFLDVDHLHWVGALFRSWGSGGKSGCAGWVWSKVPLQHTVTLLLSSRLSTYAFCELGYPRNVHLSDVGSKDERRLELMWANALHTNGRMWLTISFIPVQSSYGFFQLIDFVGNLFRV